MGPEGKYHFFLSAKHFQIRMQVKLASMPNIQVVKSNHRKAKP